MFDKFLDDYENHLVLFDELAFQQFSEIEGSGLAELHDPDPSTKDDPESASVVELDERSFTFLDEPTLAELKIN